VSPHPYPPKKTKKEKSLRKNRPEDERSKYNEREPAKKMEEIPHQEEQNLT